MKQTFYITLLLIFVPFFIITFLYYEEKEKRILEKEKKPKEVIVRVKRETTGVIDNIELEDYVVGVLAGEMPISFHLEAFKAQAVAARSYVLKRMNNTKGNEYDVVDSITNQVYLDNNYLKTRWADDYEENINKLKKAVFETKNQYISYNGEIADALFFSTSNGFTENSEMVFSFELPYLRSVESVWDEETSPVFNDKKRISLKDFYDQLQLPYSKDLEVEVLQRSNAGRVIRVSINKTEVSGVEVRTKLQLRSTDFEIIKDGEEVLIKTNGYGHGVGMSQYGALGMANNGYTYNKILQHYYQGVNIKTLKQ